VRGLGPTMPTVIRTVPAKLGPPRLQRVLMRERLFARLYEQRDGAVVWITRRPGCGQDDVGGLVPARSRAAWAVVPARRR